MANPQYVLHLTDLHLEDSPEYISNKLQPKKKKLISNLKKFLDLKSRDAFNIVVITGDIMDRNGLNVSHNLASDFINEIKEQVCNKNTGVYCTPGNHDLNDDQALKLDLLNGCRVESLKKYGKKTFPIVVDEFIEQLANCFLLYHNFMRDIDANNFKLKIDNPYYYLNGYEKIDLGNNACGIISWYNTSWLCLTDESWEKACNFEFDFTLKNFDHEKLSPGKILIEKIIREIDLIRNEALFTVAMTHHDPRLLCWQEKHNINGGCFFKSLFQNNLVLNGHTHNNLFDLPFLTTGNNNVSVIEINYMHKFNIHYNIGMNKNDELSTKILNDSRVITIFNNESKKFIKKLRSKYKLKNLLNDLKLNKPEIIDFSQNTESQVKTRFNFLEKLDYELEQKSRRILF